MFQTTNQSSWPTKTNVFDWLGFRCLISTYLQDRLYILVTSSMWVCHGLSQNTVQTNYGVSSSCSPFKNAKMLGDLRRIFQCCIHSCIHQNKGWFNYVQFPCMLTLLTCSLQLLPSGMIRIFIPACFATWGRQLQKTHTHTKIIKQHTKTKKC